MNSIIFERSNSKRGYIATVIKGTEVSASKVIARYVQRRGIELLGIVVPKQEAVNTNA